MFLKLALNAILLSGLAGVILAKEDNSMASWIRGNANKSPTPEAIAAVRKLSENLAFLEEIMGDGIGEDNFDETGEIAKLPSDQTKFNYHWGLLLAGLGNVLHHIEDGFCAIGNCLHQLGPLDTGGVNEAGNELNHTHDFDLPPHNHDFTVDKHKHNFALPNHTHPIPTLDCKCMSNCTQVCTCKNTATGKPAMVDRGMTMENEDFSGTTNHSVGGSGTTGSSGSLDHTHNLDDLQADLNNCGHDTLDAFNSMECMHMNNHTEGNHTHSPAPSESPSESPSPAPSASPAPSEAPSPVPTGGCTCRNKQYSVVSDLATFDIHELLAEGLSGSGLECRLATASDQAELDAIRDLLNAANLPASPLPFPLLPSPFDFREAPLAWVGLQRPDPCLFGPPCLDPVDGWMWIDGCTPWNPTFWNPGLQGLVPPEPNDFTTGESTGGMLYDLPGLPGVPFIASGLLYDLPPDLPLPAVYECCSIV